MEKSKASYISVKGGMKEENFLIEYSDEEKQQNEVNSENASKIFTPEFIPYYPEIAMKYSLSSTETLIYGFIRFYMKNGSGRFYFTNEQLAIIMNCSSSTINISISNLSKKGLIEKGHKIRANGGTIRFITKVRVLESLEPEYQKTDTHSIRKLIANKNKINKKVISKDITKQSFGNSDINKLILYFEETLGSVLDGTVKENRQYCFNLIRKFKKVYPQNDYIEGIKILINLALKDNFHSKNATGFKYLYYNIQKIISSYKNKKEGVFKL